VVAVVVIVAALAFIFTQQQKTRPENEVKLVEADVNQTSTRELDGSEEGVSTLAEQWQWQENTAQAENLSASSEPIDDDSPFNEQSVHDALQAVKVDENGDVILDHDAQVSLDEALERIYNKIDSNDLLRLQELIEEALPEKVGKQVSQLVGDYHQFLKAKEEFSLIYENTGNTSAEQSIPSINRDQQLYVELQALRELHLGDETAKDLFFVSDATAEFMFESMKLQLDNNISPDEKVTLYQELQAQLQEKIGDN